MRARRPALSRLGRAEKIWTAPMKPPFSNAHQRICICRCCWRLWTGQRQGDLLRLPWSAYDGTAHPAAAMKTGARVVIPVGAPLKAGLDAAPKLSTSF